MLDNFAYDWKGQANLIPKRPIEFRRRLIDSGTSELKEEIKYTLT
jgi:hypothetical protein